MNTRRRGIVALGLSGLLALTACSSDDEGDSTGGDGGAGGSAGSAAGGSGGASGGGSDFDTCVAELPTCRIAEKDTQDKIQEPCGPTEFIPIPLTDGTTHGPVTLDQGTHGAKVEWNWGAGTEFVNPVADAEATCNGTIDAFGEPTSLTDNLKNLRGLDFSLYTVFRPACMRDGETYPVISWANGTCGYTHGYAALLGAVAAHGYVVVASNSTQTEGPTTNGTTLRALDYAASINDDPESPLYQRLDLENVGVMGHSQGAITTVRVASDPRVDAIIAWNAGNSNDKPFLNVSGDQDILGITLDSMPVGVDAATQPGAWVYFHQILPTGGNLPGHLVLMEQPERAWEMTVAWWDWQLKGSDEGKAFFVGDDCGMCNRQAEFDYGHNALLQ